jgi:hypothetical protein
VPVPDEQNGWEGRIPTLRGPKLGSGSGSPILLRDLRPAQAAAEGGMRVSVVTETVSEVVPGTESGGPHTSRTIMVKELTELLTSSSPNASRADYAKAILQDNVLGKRSDSTRRRSLKYLRQLYVLDSRSMLFRALRDLSSADPISLPFLALICALARDPVFRATAPMVRSAPLGSRVDAEMLAQAVLAVYPHSYSDDVLAKIGRNAASSWTQSGHLSGRLEKTRVRARSTAAAVAYAFMVGHLADARGQGLLATVWGRALDAPAHEIYEQAQTASKLGWIEFRHAGDVVEVGFRWLLREPGR